MAGCNGNCTCGRGRGSVEPSQGFWQGHKRSPEVSEELIAVLSNAIRKYPEQRLGQIIINTMGDSSSYLWNVWDENWIAALSDSEES